MTVHYKPYLLPLCYLIAVIDLINSLCFAMKQTYITYLSETTNNIMFLVGSYLWVLLILLLFIGLVEGNDYFILIWIIISTIGLSIDVGVLIYGFRIYITHGWLTYKKPFILLTCTVLETIFIFIVYLYYKNLVDANMQKKNCRISAVDIRNEQTSNNNTSNKNNKRSSNKKKTQNYYGS